MLLKRLIACSTLAALLVADAASITASATYTGVDIPTNGKDTSSSTSSQSKPSSSNNYTGGGDYTGSGENVGSGNYTGSGENVGSGDRNEINSTPSSDGSTEIKNETAEPSYITNVTNEYHTTINYELPLAWSAVAGLRCWNNELPIQDFRMTHDVFKSICQRFNISVNGESVAAKEDLFFNNDRRTMAGDSDGDPIHLTKELAWLVENNIISSIEYLNLFSDMTGYERYAGDFDLESTFYKRDFWMALSKIGWGVIPSRLIYTVTNPERNGVVVDSIEGYVLDQTTVNAKFVGDWNIYAFPNVYELYFANLLDRSLITANEFCDYNSTTGEYVGGKDAGRWFITHYMEMLAGNDLMKQDTYPVWSTALDPIQYFVEGTTEIHEGIFGRAWKFENGIITRKRYASSDASDGQGIFFFRKETLSVLDALKIVKKFLEYTEGPMSDMEAKIVMYKYGVKYINDIENQEDRDAVAYAIARGILNFEDKSEFEGLYGNLQADMAYKLLYRVARPESRYQFRYITLTDSESFWEKRGFQETMINFFSDEITAEDIDWNAIEIDEMVNTSRAFDFPLLASLGSGFHGITSRATNIENPESPTVETKSYRCNISIQGLKDYTYKGDSLEWVNEGASYNSSNTPGTTAADTTFKQKHMNNANDEYIDSISWDSRSQMHDVVVYVKAESKAAAITKLRSYFKIKDTGERLKLSGVISSYGLTMVAKSTLEQAVSSGGNGVLSNLLFVNNNIIKNTKTGVMAVILPEQDIALVGNQVVKLEDALVVTDSNDVYYNLQVIALLLPLGYIKNLHGASFVVFNTDANRLTQHETLKLIYDADTIECDELYLYQYDGIKAPNNSDAGSSNQYDECFINLSEADKLFNTLYRVFYKDDGEIDYVLIVDWVYIYPDNVEYDTDVDLNGDLMSIAPKNGNDDYTFWYDNLAISNALANFIYETDNYNYFNCGWCTPCVTVLRTDNTLDIFNDEALLNQYRKFSSSEAAASDLREKFSNGVITPELKSNRRIIELGFALPGNGIAIVGVDGATVGANSNSGVGPSAVNTMNFTNVAYLVTKSGLVYKALSYEIDTNQSGVHRLRCNEGESIDRAVSGIKLTTPEYGFTWREPASGEVVIVKRKNTQSSYVFEYWGIQQKDGKLYYVLQGLGRQDSNSVLKFEPDNDTDQRAGAQSSIKNYTLDKLGANPSALLVNSARTIYNGIAGRIPSDCKPEIKLLTSSSTGYANPRIFGILDTSDCAGILTTINGEYKVVTSPSDIVEYDEFKRDRSGGVELLVPFVIYLPVDSAHWQYSSKEAYYEIKSDAARSLYQQAYDKGLNNRLIDRLYLEYLEPEGVNDLAVGAKLMINDIEYTKQDDGSFLSEVMQSMDESGTIVDSIKQKLTGSIHYGGNQRLSSQLKSYITNYGDGLLSDVKEDGFVYRDGPNKYLNGEIWNPGRPVSVEYRIKLELDDSLLCRRLNSGSDEDPTYLLLTVSNEYRQDYGTDSPFYSETVNLKDPTLPEYEAGAYEYPEIEGKEEIIDGVKSEFKETKSKDLKTVIFMILFVVCIILLVLIWIAYFILSQGLFKIGLESIGDLFLKDDGKRGFDPLKFLTLGIFSLDDEPRVSRLIFATVVLLILITVIGIMMAA